MWLELSLINLLLNTIGRSLDRGIVLDEYTCTSAHPSAVDELDHLLSHDGHLQDLRHRGPLLRVLVQHRANQLLQLRAVARRDRLVFVLNDLENQAKQVVR